MYHYLLEILFLRCFYGNPEPFKGNIVLCLRRKVIELFNNYARSCRIYSVDTAYLIRHRVYGIDLALTVRLSVF